MILVIKIHDKHLNIRQEKTTGKGPQQDRQAQEDAAPGPPQPTASERDLLAEIFRRRRRGSGAHGLAGGGAKRGLSYGASDDIGATPAEKRMDVHDFHATILHLMGLDHEQLTYRYSGRDFRLTDVHGHVAQEIVS